MPQIIQAPSWQKALEGAAQAKLGYDAGQKALFEKQRAGVHAQQEDAAFAKEIAKTDLEIENEKLRQQLMKMRGGYEARQSEQSLQQGRLNLVKGFIGFQQGQEDRARQEAGKPLVGDSSIQAVLQGLRPDVQHMLIPMAERLQRLRQNPKLNQDDVTRWALGQIEGAKRQMVFTDAKELEGLVANDIAGQAFADVPDVQARAEAIADSLQQLPADAAQAAELLDKERAAYNELKPSLAIAQEDMESRMRMAARYKRIADESPDLPEGLRRMYGLFSSAIVRRAVDPNKVLDAVMQLEKGDMSAATRLQQELMRQQGANDRNQATVEQRMAAIEARNAQLEAIIAARDGVTVDIPPARMPTRTLPPGALDGPTTPIGGGAAEGAVGPSTGIMPPEHESFLYGKRDPNIQAGVSKDRATIRKMLNDGMKPSMIGQALGISRAEFEQIMRDG